MADKNEFRKFSEVEIGETFSRPVLITSISESVSKNGNEFVIVGMKDGSSEQTARMFGKTIAEIKKMGIHTEMIADVTIRVDDFRSGKSFNLLSAKPTESGLTIADFTKVPPFDREKMFDEIIEMLNEVADTGNGKYTPLSDLAINILNDRKDDFMKSSAAELMHHNMLGGLIYHTYRMMKSSYAISSVYTNLDRELLLCGTALHDIGKIWEYKTTDTGEAQRTSSGILFGHLYMGAIRINQVASDINYNKEKLKLLVHMILSHHGKQEYGAVTLPAIPEALVLSHVDDLDAKMYVFDEAYKEQKPGTLSEKKSYMLETKIYKPKTE